VPGASLKGVFRSTAEALAEHLDMSTCYLERDHATCAGGNMDLGNDKREEIDRAASADIDRLLAESVCDTCRLFGSPLARGKVRIQDADLIDWAGALEIRDGVGIDRDSGTAVHNVKYDYEVVPAGARFRFGLQAENTGASERALIFAVVREWQRGFHLGGMTSRGFGAVTLEEASIKEVDLTDSDQRLAYLVDGAMREIQADAVEAAIRQALEASHA